MERKSNYFKIGLFVFFIMIAIVVTISVIGVGAFSKKPFYVETYFANSVQGLTIGSDVLFLGVPIGKVDELSFVDDYYKTDKAYIYVRVALDNELIAKKNDGAGVTHAEALDNINKKIASGLILKLASQGITGLVAIEASYATKTSSIPSLGIDWKPKYPYIPSVPSIMTQITDSIESLVNMLHSDTVQQLGGNMLSMVSNVDYIITYELTPTMQNIREVTKESTSMISNVNEILITEIQDNINPILTNIKESTDAIPKLVTDANELIVTANGVVAKTDVLLTSQLGTVAEIFKNVSDITSNLRAISESASSYSSGMLFSEPPPEARSLFEKIVKEEKKGK
jgi:phospholipid/cholesterol/gamma-HCH transport system substrate-binding protein/paraquat-inducible protein B